MFILSFVGNLKLFLFLIPKHTHIRGVYYDFVEKLRAAFYCDQNQQTVNDDRIKLINFIESYLYFDFICETYECE